MAIEASIKTAMAINLWISHQVWDEMICEAQSALPYETGGVLLGYLGVNGDYVVTNLVGPGPKAIHGKYRFLPDHEYQQTEINRIFSNSKGGIDYLGDWHTHPKSSCCMSWRDKRTLQDIALKSELNLDSPIMAIACQAERSWSIGAWAFERSRWIVGATTVDLTPRLF